MPGLVTAAGNVGARCNADPHHRSDEVLAEIDRSIQIGLMRIKPYKWHLLVGLIFLFLVVHVEEVDIDRKPHLTDPAEAPVWH